jgi:hypothetical protein
MSALHVLLATVLWLQYNSRQNGVARSDNLKGISLANTFNRPVKLKHALYTAEDLDVYTDYTEREEPIAWNNFVLIPGRSP